MSITSDIGRSPPICSPLFSDPTRGALGETELPRSLDTPFVRRASEIWSEEVADAYRKTFLVGGLVVMLAIPFSLTMRRRPSEVHAAPEAAAAATATAGG